jgi:hypothetical protein
MSSFDEMTEKIGQAVQVPEDDYWYALEVLPPIYGKKCFAMGELYTADKYFWFSQIGADYFGVLANQEIAESVFADLRTAKASEIRHCQNCNSYQSGLSLYGALVVCARCKNKLQGSEMAKRQISFFDDQKPLFEF